MWSDLLYRIRALFRRRVVERELDAELTFHLERQAEKHVRAGLGAEEAARLARLELGGEDLAKEQCREARGVVFFETILQDIGYALRLFRKNPIFTSVVVVSLALGIGANTAIFTLMDAVMWRMLPVEQPENLLSAGRFTYEQFRAMREGVDLVQLAGYSPVRLSVSVDGSMEPTADGVLVSGNYFSLLGVRPIVGRTIDIEDDRVPSGHPVAMISYGYWSRRFGRAPDIIGRSISLSGRPFTIIGITPPEFFGAEVGVAPEIFVSIMMQPTVMPASENLIENPKLYSTWIQGLARLGLGGHPEQAQAALQSIYMQHVPTTDKFGRALPAPSILLEPAARGLSTLRSRFSAPLLVLTGLVGLVLLIACTNAANLLLARAAARQGEFALRLATGASRWRLMRQLLVESTMLGLLAGLCAVPLAWGVAHLLLVYVSSGGTPISLDTDPNLRVLAFTASLSVAAGILFGLAPGFLARSTSLTSGLKSLRAVTQGRSTTGSRRVLAVVQVALSLVLLIGAGLFVRSLQNLNSQNTSLAPESLLIARVEPQGSDQRGIPGTTERLDRIYTDLLQRVRQIPGVRSASLGNVSPSRPSSGCCGFRDPTTGEMGTLHQVMVYPDYFRTLGLGLVSGRDFEAADFRENTAAVCLINETWARTRFSGEDPVGKLLGNGSSTRIIGVVRDSRHTSLRGPTEPTYYMPFLTAQTGRGQMILHVRLSGNSDAAVTRVREEIWKADPKVPQFQIHTLAQEVDAVLAQERLMAALSSAFSGLALLLAAIGLYGLLAFGVAQKTGEIGIRMALGAVRASVVWMILREALGLVAAGVVIGVPAALAATRLASSQISGLLFGLEATDPLTIATALIILTAVTLIAAYLPAKRASLVDPMTALRNE
jgi:predicted permease